MLLGDPHDSRYTDPLLLTDRRLVGGKPLYTKGIPLTTRAGSPIPNAQRLENAPATLKAAEEFARKNGGLSIQTRSLSATYNCVGLVFGARRTCIDITHLDRILKEDGYRCVESSAVHPGDVIVYRWAPGEEPTHVGLVWSVGTDRRIQVLSQWGNDGEYLHDEAQVPQPYGQNREYYTERKRP